MKKFNLAMICFLLLAGFFGGCMGRDDNNEEKLKEEISVQIQEESESLLPSKEDKKEEAHEDKKENKKEFLDKTEGFVFDENKYLSLDKTSKGWGPGGPTDENNRSAGAISYQKKYGKYNADFILPMGKEIVLTFDEGYENGYTAPILDTLKEKNVKAVFFITYPYAKDNPELVKRMIDEGHIVGNHSTNHTHFPVDPLKSVCDDVLNLHNFVKENFGYTMRFFRFPFGEFNEQCLALMNDLGYKSVFWSFAYRDWERDNQPDVETTLAMLNQKAHGGAIYLLHAVSKTNSEILGDFIDDMREKDFVFADYEEILEREVSEEKANQNQLLFTKCIFYVVYNKKSADY